MNSIKKSLLFVLAAVAFSSFPASARAVIAGGNGDFNGDGTQDRFFANSQDGNVRIDFAPSKPPWQAWTEWYYVGANWSGVYAIGTNYYGGKELVFFHPTYAYIVSASLKRSLYYSLPYSYNVIISDKNLDSISGYDQVFLRTYYLVPPYYNYAQTIIQIIDDQRQVVRHYWVNTGWDYYYFQDVTGDGF
ncbi:MAG: hypothetical protein L0228_08960, partial [Planctomycetes bacterium]|nr:hypothetical protein [Planctomycetota bacterium]